MNSTKKKPEKQCLLDVNALVALTHPEHPHHRPIQKWFDQSTNFGVCPLTEAALVRLTTNPSYRPMRTIKQALAVLAELALLPGYRYWPISHSWVALTAPFAPRLFGHQQVTDAYLLGLAVKENGILVTFDKGIQYLAGSSHEHHVLLLS